MLIVKIADLVCVFFVCFFSLKKGCLEGALEIAYSLRPWVEAFHCRVPVTVPLYLINVMSAYLNNTATFYSQAYILMHVYKCC